MDWEIIKSSIQWFSPIIGGAIVWMYTQWEKSKRTKAEAQKTIAEREQTYSQIVENRNKILLEENELLRKKLLDYHLNNISKKDVSVSDLIKELIDGDPGVSWAKIRVSENVFKVIRVSPGYARLYLNENPEYYDDKTPEEIFGKEIGTRYAKSDEKVYRNQYGVHIREEVTTAPSGRVGYFVGRKYSVYIKDDHNYIFGSGYHENLDGTVEHGINDPSPDPKD